jgi:hypothetical protein
MVVLREAVSDTRCEWITSPASKATRGIEALSNFCLGPVSVRLISCDRLQYMSVFEDRTSVKEKDYPYSGHEPLIKQGVINAYIVL